MNSEVSKYMAEIGRRGGKKSRRILTSEQAREIRALRGKKQEVLSKPAAEALSPKCLSCDSFDREKLECALEKCKHPE